VFSATGGVGTFQLWDIYSWHGLLLSVKEHGLERGNLSTGRHLLLIWAASPSEGAWTGETELPPWFPLFPEEVLDGSLSRLHDNNWKLCLFSYAAVILLCGAITLFCVLWPCVCFTISSQQMENITMLFCCNQQSLFFVQFMCNMQAVLLMTLGKQAVTAQVTNDVDIAHFVSTGDVMLVAEESNQIRVELFFVHHIARVLDSPIIGYITESIKNLDFSKNWIVHHHCNRDICFCSQLSLILEKQLFLSSTAPIVKSLSSVDFLMTLWQNCLPSQMVSPFAPWNEKSSAVPCASNHWGCVDIVFRQMTVAKSWPFLPCWENDFNICTSDDSIVWEWQINSFKLGSVFVLATISMCGTELTNHFLQIWLQPIIMQHEAATQVDHSTCANCQTKMQVQQMMFILAKRFYLF